MPTANAKLKIIEGGGVSAAESKYQIIFDQASDAVVTVSSQGKIDAVNLAAEELIGTVRSELCGQDVAAIIPVPPKHRLPERSRPLSREMLTTSGTYEDIAVLRNDGYVRLVDLSVRMIEDGGRPLSVILLRDVTAKKQMERELITKHSELRNAFSQLEKKNAELESMQQTLVQAGKMAALGELAAGIAHELNQPLMAIRGYTQELQGMTQPHSPDVAGYFKEVITAVDKMASIIIYLRTFTRKSTEGFEFTDVHERIEESLKMLKKQFEVRGIDVVRDFDPALPKVYANPIQIEQVLINLATNARDAIESTGRGKGTVTITTRKKGEFAEIYFKDDGTGMEERTKAKAFNPFYTTKEVGKGMGLGLSLSYGMINKLHGSIVVESEWGKGATFIIRLPKDFREMG